jgi:uncharacterized NAD-dependent epimerase/dehydratase family protein
VAKAGLIDPCGTDQVVLGHDPERPDCRERAGLVLVQEVIAVTTFEAFARLAARQVKMSVEEAAFDARTAGPNLRVRSTSRPRSSRTSSRKSLDIGR